MKNPYWHEGRKSHKIDHADIRLLCFDIYNLVWASANNAGFDDDDDVDLDWIEQLHFEMAEAQLSKKLLSLAILVRTFDDIMMEIDDNKKREAYIIKKTKIEENSSFGSVFSGNDKAVETIRECSNKIIHASDFRPVYHTQNDRNSPAAKWGMDGSIELSGVQGKSTWEISLNLFSYMNGLIELVGKK